LRLFGKSTNQLSFISKKLLKLQPKLPLPTSKKWVLKASKFGLPSQKKNYYGQRKGLLIKTTL